MKRPRKTLFSGAALFAIFAAVGYGRIRQSFDRLPVDPGYEFFEDSYQNGISVLDIFQFEGLFSQIKRVGASSFSTALR